MAERPDRWGIPRDYLTLLRCSLKIPFTVLRWIFSIDPQKRFTKRCWVCHQAGQIIELYRRSTTGVKSRLMRGLD
jgi:hypothetical protein